jgi:folate-binding protein YgfZ
MQALALHGVHAALGAIFQEESGYEAVAFYADHAAEHTALTRTAGLVDLSFRGRFCLTGADRVRLLNGQVTADIKALKPWTGTRAAFCGPKGRLVSDANVFALAEELLVDVEPGLTKPLIERLEHHIVAEDVQVVDAAPYYGLFSVTGPLAPEAIAKMSALANVPTVNRETRANSCEHGEIYVARHDRIGAPGFDLYAPADAMAWLWAETIAAVTGVGGRASGYRAWELARLEAGIPRFGVEMNETHLPPETGLERDAISYTKGCYTGQETIARVRTYGQVAKALRGLRFSTPNGKLPTRGAALKVDGKVAGNIVNAAWSPTAKARIAMGYLRREHYAPGTTVSVELPGGVEETAVVEALPFGRPA